MKFHWGTKIALTYGIFVLIVLTMVIYFMTTDVELVTGRYYDEGINYQEKIEILERTKALPEQVAFTVRDSAVIVQFPANFESEKISGSLLLYRPSDTKKDMKFDIKTDSTNRFIVSTLNIEKGLWKLKADWKADDVVYYSEESVRIE